MCRMSAYDAGGGQRGQEVYPGTEAKADGQFVSDTQTGVNLLKIQNMTPCRLAEGHKH